MTLERLKDYNSSLILFVLFTFIGFSFAAWGLTGNTYGLSGFGLVIIMIAIYVNRHSISKRLLLGGIGGAALGAGLAIPIGLLVGQYLEVLFGYLAAAIWGIITALVLVMVMGRLILGFLPMQAQNIIYGLAMLGGIYFGVATIGSRLGDIYGPIGGTMLIGWQVGMIVGFIVSYRNIPEDETEAIPFDM